MVKHEEENYMGNYAQNHSLRIQKRQFESVFQSITPSRASSLASLGVGLGVREVWSRENSCFPGIVVEESAKEYCDEGLFGGYMYGVDPTWGRGLPYARYGVDMD